MLQHNAKGPDITHYEQSRCHWYFWTNLPTVVVKQ